jgi:hypothetical protein
MNAIGAQREKVNGINLTIFVILARIICGRLSVQPYGGRRCNRIICTHLIGHCKRDVISAIQRKELWGRPLKYWLSKG